MRFDKNTCHALAKSARASSKVADALGDRPGVDIAVMNVPTILAIFGAAAGKLGHAGIEARRAAQGKPTIATRARGGFNRHGRQGWESRAASVNGLLHVRSYLGVKLFATANAPRSSVSRATFWASMTSPTTRLSLGTKHQPARGRPASSSS